MSAPTMAPRTGAAPDANPTNYLVVEGLSKHFGAHWALRNASFTIRRGEVLGLIGPNGSGKTTLFRSLAGVMPVSFGTVALNGRVIEPRERKHHLYFVPDGIRPWPDQSVEWVLRFLNDLYGTSLGRINAAIDALDLRGLLGAELRELSKGEHRRVMLAIGLSTPQPLLLLDEPFDGLDVRQTRDVMNVVRSHAGAGRTLFLSIHQLTDAERVCDRFVLLSGGRVVGEGTVDALRTRAGVPSDAGLDEVFLALT